MSGEPVPAGMLRDDARFNRLALPSYSLDAMGVRAGVAPALSLAGGALLLVAPAGAWLRVTRVASPAAPMELVTEVLGAELSGGPVLWLTAAAAIAATAAWRSRRRVLRAAGHAAVLSAAAVAGGLLVQLQVRIGDAAAAAIEQPAFHDLVAGVGWGAWAAAVGAACLVLSAVFAFLSTPPAVAQHRTGQSR